MHPPNCPACQSINIEPAIIGSAGVWLARQSALSRAFSAGELKATVCMDCGHIQIRTDPARLRQLVGE